MDNIHSIHVGKLMLEVEKLPFDLLVGIGSRDDRNGDALFRGGTASDLGRAVVVQPNTARKREAGDILQDQDFLARLIADRDELSPESADQFAAAKSPTIVAMAHLRQWNQLPDIELSQLVDCGNWS